eukprot:scaffold75386_cov36-Tisochrysis_lutea.AAC.1
MDGMRELHVCTQHAILEADTLPTHVLALLVVFLAASREGVPLSRCRYAACPLCSYRISQMKRRAEIFKNAGLEIVCVFEATHAQLTGHINKSNVPFPILMDPNSIMYNAYGVRSSLTESCITGCRQICIECSILPVVCRGHGRCSSQHCIPKYVSRRPADFLLDERGMIVVAHRGDTEKPHISWQTVDAFAGLNSGPHMGGPTNDVMSR